MEFNYISAAQKMFSEAVYAEESGNKNKAADLYRELIETQPKFVQAYVNMGTLYFHQKDFAKAAEFYRQATEIDPDYSLAFFNYASVLEELGQYEESINAYLRAIQIDPEYHDAHYNLALTYQRKRDSRKALRHWNAYLALAGKIDGQWAKTARDEIKKLLALDPMKIAFTNVAPARTFDPPPTLSLVQ
jgi:tetratricopeptide (TPR) repeat protein